MANLFWKQPKRTLNLLSKPFASEDEFERTIFETQELFEDLTFLKRQAQTGNGAGRPDILAVDNDGNVCIIEMKNVVVDEKIISQIVGYAVWAKSNPDSLKNLWYELADKPEIEMNWDDYEVRILVIAPEINPNTLKFLPSIHYQVDLIEIKRWVHKKDSFLLVNYLEKKEDRRTKPIKGTEIYDKKFYEKFRNTESVGNFLRYINGTKKILKNNKIDLDVKFNKYYCGFKYGFFVAFSIAWDGTRSFSYRFHLPESVARKVQGRLRMDKYYRKRATYNIIPGVTRVEDFLPLMEKSLEYMKEERD